MDKKACVLTLLLALGVSQAAEFIPLGTLPGRTGSGATGVSADGRVVVGSSWNRIDGNSAFRWTLEGGLLALPDLSGDGYETSSASAASASGALIVGQSSAQGSGVCPIQAAIWNPSGSGATGLGSPCTSEARAISAEGGVVAGYSGAGLIHPQATLWVAGGGETSLGDLTGGNNYSMAYGISADGMVVVGESESSLGRQAFRWTAQERMIGLGDLPGGEYYSAAAGISADGNVIVGTGSSATVRREAFRWTLEEGMIGLGDLGGDSYSAAYAVSGEGDIVVGSSDAPGGSTEIAFIWSQSTGMRSLREVLIENGATGLEGWVLQSATGISADGSKIVGLAYRRTDGPRVSSTAYLADLSTAWKGRKFIRAVGDIDGNGTPDFAAVLPDGRSLVKGLDDSPVAEFVFTDISAVMDVEVLNDLNGNGSRELVALGSGENLAEVRDGLTGAQLAVIPFADSGGSSPVDLEILTDQNGNGVEELACLLANDALVDVRDALTGSAISSVSFSNWMAPVDLEIYPDLDGDGVPELSVLGVRAINKSDKLEIRDLFTGEFKRNIYLNRTKRALGHEFVADVTGDGEPDVAILRSRQDEPQGYQIVVRPLSSNSVFTRFIHADVHYPPQKLLTLSDQNGNQSNEVVVFGRRLDGGNQKAQVKDTAASAGERRINAVFFDPNFAGVDITSCPDINGNGYEELVMLGLRAPDGKLRAIVKDAVTGELIGKINFN